MLALYFITNIVHITCMFFPLFQIITDCLNLVSILNRFCLEILSILKKRRPSNQNTRLLLSSRTCLFTAETEPAAEVGGCLLFSQFLTSQFSQLCYLSKAHYWVSLSKKLGRKDVNQKDFFYLLSFLSAEFCQHLCRVVVILLRNVVEIDFIHQNDW